MSNVRSHAGTGFAPIADYARHRVDLAQTATVDRQPRVGDVQWTLVYVAFLLYIAVVVTYEVALGDVAVAAGLIGLLAQRGIRTTAFFGWLIAFVFWCLFGFLQSSYPEAAWEKLIVLGKISLICLVALNAMRTFAQIRFFMIFFLCCFALYPARGAIFNYVLAGYTLVGRAIWNHVYSNPNDLAALILLPLSIAAALYDTDRSPWIRRGALASLFVLPILSLMTQSRGGAIALLVFGALALKRQGKRVRAFMAFAALAMFLSMFSSGVLQRFEQTSITGEATSDAIRDRMAASSAQQRWSILKVASKIAEDHPVFGVGFGAYPLAHANYDPLMGLKSAHNTYLQVAAETGFPGLLIFVGLLGATFYRAEKVRRRCTDHMARVDRWLWYLEAGLIAYLVAGVFGSFEKLAFLYIHLVLIWALADVASRQLRRAASEQAIARAN